MGRRQTAIVAVIVVVVAGCSGDENIVAATTSAPATSTTAPPIATSTTNTPTTSTADPGPVADASEAVAAAAQALLGLPAIQATHVDYDRTDEPTTTRWLNWRDNGDLFLMVATGLEIGAIAQVGANLLTAASSDLRNEPWTATEPPLPTADVGVVLNIDLVGLAGGSLVKEMAGIPRDEIEVESDTTDGGGITWTMRFPFGGATATRQWTIDSAGRLRSYLLTSDADEPVLGAFATSEFRFDPLDEQQPIVLPEEGSALDIRVLNLPDDLRLPGR